MSRDSRRTSLILGEQDVVDLRDALNVRLRVLRTNRAISRLGLEEIEGRALGLLRRLNDAARRLERGRNGRSAAAR